MLILKDIWRGNVSADSREVRKGTEYTKAQQEAMTHQEIFFKELSQEGKKAFDDFILATWTANEIAECDCFIQGFRIGAKVILDVVNDYKSPFPFLFEMKG